MPDKKTLKSILKRKEAFIDESLKGLSSDIQQAQYELFNTLFDGLFARLEFDTAGLLVQNSKNLRLVAEIDLLFDSWAEVYQNPVLKTFTQNLLKLAPYSVDYFTELGYAKKATASLAKAQALIQNTIGIKETAQKGVFDYVKGSYLETLSKNEQTRMAVKDYLLNSVNSKVNYQDFSKGLKTLIEGMDGDKGKLERYWGQFAFDTYNQVNRAVALFFADELGLNYFIYEGGLIETSRPFCEKKNGKVFHRKETEEWKDDPDLVDKATADSYIPLIELGRYNCRHMSSWITDDMAESLGRDVEKDKQITSNNEKEAKERTA